MPKCLDACRLAVWLHYSTAQKQRPGKTQQGKAHAKHRRQSTGGKSTGKAQQAGAAGQSTGKAQQAKRTRAKHRQSTGKAQQAKHSRRNKAQQAKHRQSIVGKSYLFQSSQTVAAKDCKKTLSYTAASQQSAFCQSCPLADPPQSSSSVKSQCCRPSLIFFTP